MTAQKTNRGPAWQMDSLPENRPEEISRNLNQIKMDQYMQYYCPVRPDRPAYADRKPVLLPALLKGLDWLKERLPQQKALDWPVRLSALFKWVKIKTA